ncbi:hypothetical protein M422DRAFT_268443 [Sphaerobolus stellatus SS14]|uniref:Uncharacterized protein n=1 Tax=Sphaerobolus stellatus (strain SS14) TaxID=990650 RepID=A0A0C9UXI3_SPHS4|nr:hypothetical protein M422DRAFT_268443 [Sphaerobolus stellatus SS14]
MLRSANWSLPRPQAYPSILGGLHPAIETRFACSKLICLYTLCISSLAPTHLRFAIRPPSPSTSIRRPNSRHAHVRPAAADRLKLAKNLPRRIPVSLRYRNAAVRPTTPSPPTATAYHSSPSPTRFQRALTASEALSTLLRAYYLFLIDKAHTQAVTAARTYPHPLSPSSLSFALPEAAGRRLVC